MSSAARDHLAQGVLTTPERAPLVEELYHSAVAPTGEPRVFAFHALADPAHLDGLHVDERLAAATMADGRAAEYATARACARASLASLGIARPVPRMPSGAPAWPKGSAGSISHSRGYCAAVGTSDSRYKLGLDIEEVGRVGTRVARRILTPAEQERLAAHPDGADSPAAGRAVAVTFAAKEAFYKAHHQIDPRYLGFHVIEFEPWNSGLDAPTPLKVVVGSTATEISDAEANDAREPRSALSIDPQIVDNTTIVVRVVGPHVIAAAVIASRLP